MIADTPEIVPADRALRRRTLLAAVLLLVVLGTYSGYLLIEIRAYQTSERPDPAVLATQMHWMSLGLVAACVLLGIYLLVMALRVLREGRFPPEGVRVVRNTRVRRGRAALVIVIAALLSAGLLPLVALTVNGFVSRFLGIAPLF